MFLPLITLLFDISLFNIGASLFELSASVSLGVCIVGKYESGCRKYTLPVN